MDKDSTLIPKGPYCYVLDFEKNANKEKDDTKYYTKTCPYWSYVEDDGVKICHCSFLNEGGIPNETSEEDFEKLSKKYGSDDAVWKKYPLNLLWDQVKECGENDD